MSREQLVNPVIPVWDDELPVIITDAVINSTRIQGELVNKYYIKM